MKLITRDTDYAIRALSYIARRKGEIVTAEALVKCLKIPRSFLRKILQRLNKEGVLESRKGKGGGFVLTRRASNINVADLISIFQAPFKISEHTFRKNLCPHIRVCAVRKRLDEIERHVIKELRALTIESIVKEMDKKS